jgi:signal transduction histidine kinase
LRAADRAKSNFLATMSHELRTPLTSVIGYSEMLLEGLAGALTPEQRDYVSTILGKADQLLQLITSVLDMSRAEGHQRRGRRRAGGDGRAGRQRRAPASRRRRTSAASASCRRSPRCAPSAIAGRSARWCGTWCRTR